MIEGKQTTKGVAGTPPAGFKLADIYYVLFRKKWLILGFLFGGVIAAAIVYFSQQTLYRSEARLLVRYVVDSKSMDSGLGAAQSPNSAGDAIISSEIAILTSFDLCKQVAELVGPERVLGKDGGSNAIAAAAMISEGLTADNPPRSSIINIRFLHPDPVICKDVLSQVIESYFKRHIEFHSVSKAYDDVLTGQANKLLARIRDNRQKLHDLQVKADVISVEETKENLGGDITRLRREIFNAEALLAEYNLNSGSPVPSTNDARISDAPAPPEKIAEYKFVCARLDSLRTKNLELSSEFTDESPQVKRVREQIEYSEQRKMALEEEFPKLVGLFVAPSSPVADSRPALESRIRLLTNELAHVRAELAALDDFAISIADLERTLRHDEQSYQHIAAGLEAARFDEVLANVRTSNIQPVQTPSPPAPNVTKRLKKAGTALGGFLFAGIAFAFLLEWLIDTTVRRSSDFETKLHIPLFLSIPKLALNGHAKMLPFPTRLLAAAPAGEGDGAVADPHHTWDSDHALRQYIDGLRDRVLVHFGGDPHKPKLIGVTSCSSKVGVTSIAAGLAGALSETGDGNVLLLNLNFEAEAIHPFYRGELACDLTDALESGRRQSGMVLQNLYVATAGSSNDPATNNLSKQLARVVPKLRVSDYDYIVFDLPPTTPTTMTARLAGLMDLVMLVVESEKDTQDEVNQAAKLLARSKAPVSAVLNKVRNPVPRWLHKGA